jgi:hypothetical protein
MKQVAILIMLALAGLCAACSTNSPSTSVALGSNSTLVPPAAVPETVLLVSLEDGSVIMQKIISSANICFKKNSESATTCLTQGAPIFSSVTDTVIGYEMIEEHIDLVAMSQ